MSRFFWVRHGPTHSRALIGRTDLPADLSDRAALDRLSAFLPPEALVVSSDLSRAVATADAIQSGRPRLAHDPDLREMDFGDWEGLAAAEVAERWPDLSRAYWERPGDTAPPGGESWNAAAARVSSAVDRLLRSHPGRDIVAVAHFGVILTRLQIARGCDAAEVLAQRIDNLSVTCLTRAPGGWSIGPINHRP